ncbi:MAG: hypothetical protein AB8G05_04620 [Oligoflexales bacterium]
MFITLGNLNTFREEFKKTLSELEEEQKRAFLYNLLHQKKSSKKNRNELINCMLANIFWVRLQFHNNFNEGSKCLKYSCKIIKIFTKENRKLSSISRDIEHNYANFQARELNFGEAIPLYLKLVSAERQPNRKTKVIVNLLRSYIKMGLFYKALDTCFKKNPL